MQILEFRFYSLGNYDEEELLIILNWILNN